jgi:predicted RND superfamily exporter protein
LLASLGELTAEQRLARLQALDSDLRSDLTEQLQRLELAIAAEPFTRDELPLELRERWVNERGQELVEIVPAENVDDNAAAERFVTAVRPVVATVTGLPVVYLEASATIVQSFMLALAYAFVMVVALLYFFLRSFRDTYLVVVPIIFAATVTAGLTVWLGLPLNFANIIALPLLVGIGVDSGIHMVHRMRTEPTQARDPLGTSTSRAVFASGLTTIASFGNLAFSAHVGMASMGQLLTLGMVVTLVATLMLLPALMRLKRS